MNICLNMIVRNESARIERALASVAPYINSFVIVDTGSTDDTKQKIIDFFKARGIIGEIRDEPFIDWSQARNAAIGWARRLAVVYLPDYLLLCDADMELVVRDKDTFFAALTGEAHEMQQEAGSLHYANVRLVKASSVGLYKGVTHEYYDAPAAEAIGTDIAFFKDHADGANRPEKFKRDIRLLKADLKVDPNNPRSMFYLAQSYRDAGRPLDAIKWFKRRVAAGGWDEEVWNAQLNLAHCYKGIDDAKFIYHALQAYSMRPSRAEPMYDLAHYYRHLDGHQPAALACAEAVAHLPKSNDKLFVNDYVYKAGVKEEISICAFYVPGKQETGFRASNALSLLAGQYAGARELARTNMFYYIQPLSAHCPSFKWAGIPFPVEEGWAPMNPSITVHQGTVLCNIRTVNYKMDEQGRYLIRGTDGEANNTNPIVTRNFIGDLGSNGILGDRPLWTREVLAPPLPVEFPPVIGFEDLRLFSVGSTLHGSATVRQIHPDGNCEQVRAKIIFPPNDHRYAYLTDPVRMLREPRQTEKNWAPIDAAYQGPGDTVKDTAFMYRPLHIVDSYGITAHTVDPGQDVGQISGSSQVIPFKDGWLAVVHEARYLGEGQRYYWHRFAYYDSAFTTVQFSRPFYFNDKVIEFCAGMCHVPGTSELAISYGYKDAEARIATVQEDEVEKFIWLDQRS